MGGVAGGPELLGVRLARVLEDVADDDGGALLGEPAAVCGACPLAPLQMSAVLPASRVRWRSPVQRQGLPRVGGLKWLRGVCVRGCGGACG